MTQDHVAMLQQLRATLEDAGIFIAADVHDDVLELSGEVDSAGSRGAAIDIATALAQPQGLRVSDALDVLQTVPDTGFLADYDSGGGDFAFVDVDSDNDGALDLGFEREPDFTGPVGTIDSEVAAAEAEPYFPPTDPVVEPSIDNEQLNVVGGFGATSMEETAGEAGFDDRNDDDITLDVLRELRKDALTTDLIIRVVTNDGVVNLYGQVESPEDAENAEAVASRVGGVKEVREELRIVGPPGR